MARRKVDPGITRVVAWDWAFALADPGRDLPPNDSLEVLMHEGMGFCMRVLVAAQCDARATVARAYNGATLWVGGTRVASKPVGICPVYGWPCGGIYHML